MLLATNLFSFIISVIGTTAITSKYLLVCEVKCCGEHRTRISVLRLNLGCYNEIEVNIILLKGIQSGARNFIPLIVHITHSYCYKGI